MVRPAPSGRPRETRDPGGWKRLAWEHTLRWQNCRAPLLPRWPVLSAANSTSLNRPWSPFPGVPIPRCDHHRSELCRDMTPICGASPHTDPGWKQPTLRPTSQQQRHLRCEESAHPRPPCSRNRPWRPPLETPTKPGRPLSPALPAGACASPTANRRNGPWEQLQDRGPGARETQPGGRAHACGPETRTNCPGLSVPARKEGSGVVLYEAAVEGPPPRKFPWPSLAIPR